MKNDNCVKKRIKNAGSHDDAHDTTLPNLTYSQLTLTLLDDTEGNTSPTVLSTSTPPTRRNALRSGSSGFSVSSTSLFVEIHFFVNLIMCKRVHHIHIHNYIHIHEKNETFCEKNVMKICV